MKKEAALIFYVGNGMIKGGISVSDGKSEKPFLIYTEKYELPLQDTIDRDRLKDLILSGVEKVSENIKKNGYSLLSKYGVKVNEAFMIISSPWFISQTTTVKIQKNEPTLVTESLIDDGILDSFSRKNIEKDDRTEIVEQKILSVHLNGYLTNNPIGKLAKDIDISVFVSFSEKNFILELKNRIQKHVSVGKIFNDTLSLIELNAVRDIYPDKARSVIVDITSEMSEVILVNHGSISDATSFPLGNSSIIRRISNNLKVSLDVALSLQKLYIDGHLDEKLKIRIDEAILVSKKDWLAEFTKALSKISVSSVLPNDIFLFVHTDFSKLFLDFINSEEYHQYNFTAGKFNVVCVGSEELINHCGIKEKAVADLSLLLASAYHYKINSVK